MKLIDQFDNPADLHAKTAELRRTAGETLEDVRLLSRELRPSALDDLGLVAALERFVHEFTQRYPHLTVDLHIKLPERLPSMIETSLYRIVQEAMSNAARHGGADTLSILLTHRESHVQAIIEDNGSGFDVEAVRRAGSSVGLHSMTERAELLGGQVQLESSADGTAVYVEIPL
jgi:signal transduction histidine kinase